MTEVNGIELGFDPQWAKEELERREWGEARHDTDQEERSMCLGTVFSLTPSGKYYTPFACGNVEPCPECGGAGELPNPHKDFEIEALATRASFNVRNSAVQTHGLYCNGDWPKELTKGLRGIGIIARLTAPAIECKNCGGMGSREAYLDSLWWEACETLYDSHGFSIESSDGDPCDIFAVQYRDKED